MSIPQVGHDPNAPARAEDERVEIESLSKGPFAYRTISEVADELHVPQHVLRFWETRFSEVKPLKRGGGRRYYSPEDLDILRRVTDLLYVQGYTIKGVQRVLCGKAPRSTEAAVSHRDRDPDPVAEKDEDRPALFKVPEIPVVGAENKGLSARVRDVRATATEMGAAVDAVDLPERQSDKPPAQEREDKKLALLVQELEAVRVEREALRFERRGLRLALEDILSELDNLRQLLPES